MVPVPVELIVGAVVVVLCVLGLFVSLWRTECAISRDIEGANTALHEQLAEMNKQLADAALAKESLEEAEERPLPEGALLYECETLTDADGDENIMQAIAWPRGDGVDVFDGRSCQWLSLEWDDWEAVSRVLTKLKERQSKSGADG